MLVSWAMEETTFDQRKTSNVSFDLAVMHFSDLWEDSISATNHAKPLFLFHLNLDKSPEYLKGKL